MCPGYENTHERPYHERPYQMTSDSEEVTPPEGLPDRIVDDLSDLSTKELRKTIIHAQELLQAKGEHASPVEPQPGDDIIRATEHEGYTEVVKEVTLLSGYKMVDKSTVSSTLRRGEARLVTSFLAGPDSTW
jgi:hypothetical protein